MTWLLNTFATHVYACHCCCCCCCCCQFLFIGLIPRRNICSVCTIQRKATVSALKSMAVEMDKRAARAPGAADANDPPAEQVHIVHRRNTTASLECVETGGLLCDGAESSARQMTIDRVLSGSVTSVSHAPSSICIFMFFLPVKTTHSSVVQSTPDTRKKKKKKHAQVGSWQCHQTYEFVQITPSDNRVCSRVG